MDVQVPPPNSSAPQILEIGQVPRMQHAYPLTTEFFSTYVMDSKRSIPPGSKLVSATTLVQLARRLSEPGLDLVVVHASAHGSFDGLVRTVFRRSTLDGHVPLFRGLAQQLLRRSTIAPIAVLDLHDSPSILSCNLHLLRRSTLYFKRELPPDRWQLLMRSGKTPTLRYRKLARYRSALSRIRPLSLGLPENMLACGAPKLLPAAKDIDVFFAGRFKWSSTVRERGVEELEQLRNEGFRIDIQEGGLSPRDYLARCARAWLVWSPEGYGWDCFRSYEAAFAGSVPLISRQTIERHEPFIDGKHAVYYDVEPGQLTLAVRRALNDRAGLMAMAQAAQSNILKHHTPHALARYVAETTLAAAGRNIPAI